MLLKPSFFSDFNWMLPCQMSYLMFDSQIFAQACKQTHWCSIQWLPCQFLTQNIESWIEHQFLLNPTKFRKHKCNVMKWFQIDFGEFHTDKGRGSGGNLKDLHVLQALDKFYPYRHRDGLTPDALKYVFVTVQIRNHYYCYTTKLLWNRNTLYPYPTNNE